MERLLILLNHINKTIKNSDMDCVCLVIGDPGSGKSSFDLWLATEWEKLNERTFNIENLAWDGKRFLNRMHMADRYSAIVNDEGIESLFSRRAMSRGNVSQIKAFVQARADRNLFILINMTDIRLIESNIRSSRATVLFRTVMKWDVENEKLVKGFVEVYDNEAMNRIKYDSSGVEYPEPTFIDTFPNIKELNPKMWEAYLAKANPHKKANRQTSLDDWDKRPVKSMKDIKKEVELELFVRQLYKKRFGRPTILKKSRAKYGRHITDGKIRWILNNKI
jgi:hypothetical protein